MTVNDNAVAITALQNDIVGLQEVIRQLIQNKPSQEQIASADKIAEQNAITCFGTFCGITVKGVNYHKVTKCMRDCPITNACISATQLAMMARVHGISGMGEN